MNLLETFSFVQHRLIFFWETKLISFVISTENLTYDATVFENFTILTHKIFQASHKIPLFWRFNCLLGVVVISEKVLKVKQQHN
jgi:hypothetical protein